MHNYFIAPSILSANFARLGVEIEAVLAAGADLIHFDVMDNHYVPNLSFGPMVCKALRDYGIQAPIDVHLMVEPVDDMIIAFAQAGASWISIHPEATSHLDRSLQLIRDQGCKVGLALNPATPLSYLDYTLEKLDFILLMSVNPGFSGQSFIPSSLAKIKQVKQLLNQSKPAVRLAVDGGVKVENICQIAQAGADTFVAGSAIFATPDYTATIQSMRTELAKS